MGRKGGGRAAFVKAAMRAPPRSDVQEEQEIDVLEKEAMSKGDKIINGGGEIPKTDAQESPDSPEKVPEQETKGQMTQRHKREAKALKENVKRMGKKGKEEGAKLMSEMEDRHAAELKNLEVRDTAPTVEEVTISLYSSNVGEPRKTKAQKRREKMMREEQEREERIAVENETRGESEKQVEEAALTELLHSSGLAIHDIVPDGHCLYKSLEDQIHSLPDVGATIAATLDQDPSDLSYMKLRSICADSLRSHKDDFIHFLAEEDVSSSEGDGYEAYCNEVEKTAAWGGHLEIQALSIALKVHIKVYTVGISAIDIGEEYHGENTFLQICYLKHAFGLGEHYNSTRSVESTDS